MQGQGSFFSRTRRQVGALVAAVAIGGVVVLAAPDAGSQSLEDKRAEAEQITPGYNSPTINRLEQAGWCSVRAMVKRGEVIDVMEHLEQLGATAILETAISHCRL